MLQLNGLPAYFLNIWSGSIAYTKFKDATRRRSCAFVEFCDSESAAKAVTEYAASSEYHVLTEDPGQSCSIQVFDAESQDEKRDKKKTSTQLDTEEPWKNL
ncbi:uncharacterized protein LOC124349851 [Daphnia pulicaria]|uniref:uncharacterized protein LOC124349851 n=1 Tax=Daphnia pulicaria TaxID=35523 RepID=UPI001EECD118|nr:uncharacterized protein LOC124349851 [Daphnia pulicaria]